jgi:deoxyribonuclease V
MFACVDVHYYDNTAVAACVLFQNWADAHSMQQITVSISDIKPYQPGKFYERELPCILKVLDRVPQRPDTIVIDGYVWLDTEKSPGLGSHIYQALHERAAIIGVAKSKFQGSNHAQKVLRGTSKRPLYITAAGIDSETASCYVKKMHGKFRIPTLLKLADTLCRTKQPLL